MTTYNIIGDVAYILVMAGALSWGIIGLFGIDLVARLFGAGSVMSRVIYILVGVAAIVLLLHL